MADNRCARMEIVRHTVYTIVANRVVHPDFRSLIPPSPTLIAVPAVTAFEV